MATHSRIPAWKISWTEEPGGPQSTGSKSWTQLKPLGKHPHTTFHYWIVPADWTTWLKLDNHILPLHNLKLRFVNANLFLLVTWRQHKQLKRLVYGFVYLATYVEKQISVSTERKEWSTSIEPGTEAGNHISPAGSDDVPGSNPDFGLHLTPLLCFNNFLFSNLVWSYSYL